MITLERASYQKEDRIAEYCGLSADDKATIQNPNNGDIYAEIDTGNKFRYNEEAGTWVLQPDTGGGGGGGDTGVTSFNGRTGAVMPQTGDYTAEQVGALPTTGGTMTGALILGGDPTEQLQAATKEYVDNADDQLSNAINDITDGTTELPYVKTSGAETNDFRLYSSDENVELQSTQTSILLTARNAAQQDNIASVELFGADSQVVIQGTGGVTIHDIQEPTDADMAANKQYVDDQINGIVSGDTEIPYLSNTGGSLQGNSRYIRNCAGISADQSTDLLSLNGGSVIVYGTNTAIVNGVRFINHGSSGTIQLVADGEQDTDAVNLGQLNAVSNRLPTPTSEDEGKVLVVENGAYVLKSTSEL